MAALGLTMRALNDRYGRIADLRIDALSPKPGFDEDCLRRLVNSTLSQRTVGAVDYLLSRRKIDASRLRGSFRNLRNIKARTKFLHRLGCWRHENDRSADSRRIMKADGREPPEYLGLTAASAPTIFSFFPSARVFSRVARARARVMVRTKWSCAGAPERAHAAACGGPVRFHRIDDLLALGCGRDCRPVWA
jgi:hypothetical protein